jgi:hypothetical protein
MSIVDKCPAGRLPERIYLARRAAHLSRLTGTGMSPERAEEWCAAW